MVEAAAARGFYEFENTIGTDDTGFLAVDDTNKVIVLAFRGSVSSENWHQDLKMLKVHHLDLCDKCHIHKGFWESWVQIRDEIKERVQQLVAAYPEYRFVITGHSLGGAVATLAAGDIRKVSDDLAKRTELFTFGSPRVGNKAAAKFLSKQSSLSYRITSIDDPVPRLPAITFNYRHTSPEYWIFANPENPGSRNILVLNGYYNICGNSGTTGLNFERHGQYFSKSLAECGPVHDESK